MGPFPTKPGKIAFVCALSEPKILIFESYQMPAKMAKNRPFWLIFAKFNKIWKNDLKK